VGLFSKRIAVLTAVIFVDKGGVSTTPSQVDAYAVQVRYGDHRLVYQTFSNGAPEEDCIQLGRRLLRMPPGEYREKRRGAWVPFTWPTFTWPWAFHMHDRRERTRMYIAGPIDVHDLLSWQIELIFAREAASVRLSGGQHLQPHRH
jgi:hypothetical protein